MWLLESKEKELGGGEAVRLSYVTSSRSVLAFRSHVCLTRLWGFSAAEKASGESGNVGSGGSGGSKGKVENEKKRTLAGRKVREGKDQE